MYWGKEGGGCIVFHFAKIVVTLDSFSSEKRMRPSEGRGGGRMPSVFAVCR